MAEKKQTLLDKAKAIKVDTMKGKKTTDEEMELGLAWIRGDVTFKQVDSVMKGGYSKLGLVLRSAYRAGLIVDKAD